MSTPTPPIPASALLTLLLQLGLLLLSAHVLGRVAMRLRAPAVVGELLVGVLLGPSVLGHLSPLVSAWLFPTRTDQFHLLDAVGQIGMLLLVGLTGVHLDATLVRRRGVTAAGISFGGLIVPLGLGIATGLFVPARLVPGGTEVEVFALFLGVAMCVSAIPVIAKTLLDLRLLHRDIGQLILVAGMVDDAVGWALLSVVSAMAMHAASAGTVLASVTYMAGVVLFALTVGRVVVRAVFRFTAGSREAGPTVAVASVLMLLAAAGTLALGLEAVFGVFVCGILIGNAGRVEPAKLAPLRTVVLAVFAPIFFATAGMRMDLTALARPSVLATGAVLLAVAIVGKFLGAYVGARLSRLNSWEALALGAGLNARGVIEVVVATVGLRLNILSEEVYTIVILIAIVTSLMAPPILRAAVARLEHTAEERLREHHQRAWDGTPVGDVR